MPSLIPKINLFKFAFGLNTLVILLPNLICSQVVSTVIPEQIDSNKTSIPFIDIQNAPAPLYRDPVYDGVADPSIIFDSKKGTWFMFYTQRRANLNGLEGVAYCYGSAIGIASSTDNGITWSYLGQAHLPQPNEGLNTFWAPQILFDEAAQTYHMFVTYIEGVYSDWGGSRQLFHYTSKNLITWDFKEQIGTSGCIDPYVRQMEDGSWKMWFKNEEKGSLTYTATSSNLFNWTILDIPEGGNSPHEGPIVFSWKNNYWMITDKWDGMDIYTSSDLTKWNYNNSILNTRGNRPDDNVMGRHADVVITEKGAYIFYFTHPGRIYSEGTEIYEETYRYRRSSLQIAELELQEGIMVCNRNKYSARITHKD